MSCNLFRKMEGVPETLSAINYLALFIPCQCHTTRPRSACTSYAGG